MQYALPFLIETPEETKSGALPGRTRRIALGETIVSYSLRRTKRRTIGLVIGEEGLQAAAPRWVTIAEIEAFIVEKQRWILRNLAAAPRRPPAFVWEHGARLPFLGKDIEIFVTGGDLIALQAQRLRVGLDKGRGAPALREAVLGWLKLQALAHFRQRCAHIAPLLKVTVPKLGLSRAQAQWGNCSRKPDGSARILLNWKLIHYDTHLIDYVVAHELAHLRHMNHSAAFWRAVGSVYPQYEAARRELRERAHSIPAL